MTQTNHNKDTSICIKSLKLGAFIPFKDETDNGWSIRLHSGCIIDSGQTEQCYLNIGIQVPSDTFCYIYPNPNFKTATTFDILNKIIDDNTKSNIFLTIKNTGQQTLHLNRGDTIAYMYFMIAASDYDITDTSNFNETIMHNPYPYQQSKDAIYCTQCHGVVLNTEFSDLFEAGSSLISLYDSIYNAKLTIKKIEQLDLMIHLSLTQFEELYDDLVVEKEKIKNKLKDIMPQFINHMNEHDNDPPYEYLDTTISNNFNNVDENEVECKEVECKEVEKQDMEMENQNNNDTNSCEF